MIMYLKPERIRRETEKAYLLQCPEAVIRMPRLGFGCPKVKLRFADMGITPIYK